VHASIWGQVTAGIVEAAELAVGTLHGAGTLCCVRLGHTALHHLQVAPWCMFVQHAAADIWEAVAQVPTSHHNDRQVASTDLVG
jgi:hypothetical protein